MTPPTPHPEKTPSSALADRIVPSYAPLHPNRKFFILKGLVATVLTLVVLTLVLSFWGRARWIGKINTQLHALEAATTRPHPQRYEDEQLKPLPRVVRLYLSQALNPYQPLVRGVYMEQSGTLNRGSTFDNAQWAGFTARQRSATQKPGFVWDASVQTPIGVSLRMLDAYIARSGTKQHAPLGLIDFDASQDSGEVARQELIRYVAESVWYPTALLPGPSLQWTALDAQTAQISLTDGALTVRLRFWFNAEGLVERIESAERQALVDGVWTPMPWEMRLSNYQRMSGMLVPMEAEAAWITPQGRQPYWRAKVDALDYDMPR